MMKIIRIWSCCAPSCYDTSICAFLCMFCHFLFIFSFFSPFFPLFSWKLVGYKLWNSPNTHVCKQKGLSHASCHWWWSETIFPVTFDVIIVCQCTSVPFFLLILASLSFPFQFNELDQSDLLRYDETDWSKRTNFPIIWK